jgi:rSAM/selenodomain-associated transferase 1
VKQDYAAFMRQQDYPGTLAIFAREPVPGKTKTRLIPALGPSAAAQLSAAFTTDLLCRCARDLPQTTRILICYADPEAESYFRKLIRDHAPSRTIALHRQVPGGLGARLAAVKAELKGSVIYIGTDAPDLPLSEMELGLSHAHAGGAYILKALDGGYALLALPVQAQPAVFEAIDWSTPHTARQQIERINASGIEIVESTQIWWDVDEPADLAPLLSRLEKNPQIAPLTLSLLRTLPFPGSGAPR